jgi:uncharacterized protein YndB with AHSA1/START domain
MSAIVEERTINAVPQRLWSALTRQDEIVQWWSNEAQIKSEVGSLSHMMDSLKSMSHMNGHTGIGAISWAA